MFAVFTLQVPPGYTPDVPIRLEGQPFTSLTTNQFIDVISNAVNYNDLAMSLKEILQLKMLPRNPIQTLEKHLKDAGKYFKFNFKYGPGESNVIAQMFHEFMKGISFLQIAETVTHLNLMFFGLSGTGTAIHNDPASALNVAYAVDEFNPALPVSQWMFVHPSKAADVDNWMKQRFSGNGLGVYDKVWKEEDMIALQQFLGKQFVHIISQFSGGMVQVPPGWMHAVTNIQACVKFAVEYVTLNNMPTYAMAFNQVNRMYGEANPAPYIRFGLIAINMIMNAAHY